MVAKPTYSMSSVGGCERAVIAGRLGYDQVSEPEFMQTAAREGQRHEDFIAEDLRTLGYEVTSTVHCNKCNRDGTHVEIERPAYLLVGHVDRFATSAVRHYLSEFKALGRFRAQKLVRSLSFNTFKQDFPAYAMQVSLYCHAAGLPILYAVKNRDTGKVETFEIPAPFSREEIDDYILNLEIQARKEQLPKCRYKREDFERTICPFKYLCAGEDTEEPTTDMPSEELLKDAADSWRYSKVHEQEAKEELEKA